MIAAGRASARDPRATFEMQRAGRGAAEVAKKVEHAMPSPPGSTSVVGDRTSQMPPALEPLTGSPSRASSGLTDAQGRRISYLRVSLTDRCNFRCTYCSPAQLEAPEGLLSRAELARLFRVFAGLGMRRIRLTGGEPTLRKDIVEIVGDAAATPGVEEVALTTNGHRLDELAGPLHQAGLGALNVSLDTLQPDRLLGVSGRGARLSRILAGIEASAGKFRSLKVNTVVMSGVNEDELGDLVRYAWDRGALPRFIEQMPFAGGGTVPLAQIRRRLEEQGFTLEPDGWRGWGPARHMRARDVRGQGGGAREGIIGFIGAMTENFCDDCNRARVTAEGGFQACLGGEDRADLRGLLRGGADDAALGEAVRGALSRKAPRHHMEQAGAGGLVLLSMRGIGG